MTARKPCDCAPHVRPRVFVYGTLLPAERNHRYLERAQLVGPARTKAVFALHNLGLFPGLVAGGTHSVLGEIYEVDEPTSPRSTGSTVTRTSTGA